MRQQAIRYVGEGERTVSAPLFLFEWSKTQDGQVVPDGFFGSMNVLVEKQIG